jgi:hypothetical protein
MGAKSLLESKFEQRIPSAQAAVDIFSGKWASNLSQILPVTGTGTANLFNDPRVKLAAAALGANGRVNGMRILEVGPLEGAHTYLLEQLGAGSVTAVESNTEAFLKCILVKDMLGLKANFLCGDAVLFLKESDEQYDLVFCSGFLYHLMDPLETIRLICSRTSRCFVWTHYHQEGHTAGVNRIAETASRDGFETTYWTFSYPTTSSGAATNPRHR